MEHAGTAMLDPEFILGKLELAPGQRLADLGCGRTGHFIFQAARRVGDEGLVYAVDIMKDILESIQSRVRTEGFDNIHTVWSDIERLGYTPIPEASLDVAFFVNVLSHVTDQKAALQEAARLLKPEGRLMIIDWAKPLGPLGPDSTKRLTTYKVSQIAGVTGYAPLDEFAAGPYHFGVILKKL